MTTLDLDKQQQQVGKAITTTVLVAALGYFVDVYDLVLFLIIGVKSIKGIGVQENIIDEFQSLLDIQMIGMLLGGVFWGILGDKKGRLSVLFGSIIMYSLANIANGFVDVFHDKDQAFLAYGILRFIAGFGLAGELGAGITLVSEVMSKEKRGYGTMIVASVGVTGAIVAALVGKFLSWQIAYFIGGGLGLSLLMLRIGVFESGMFEKSKKENVQHGNFFDLFKHKKILLKYVYCILIGSPIWFVIGILIGRAPEFAGEMGISNNGLLEREYSIMFCYAGLVFGDIASGALSQVLKSRKKAFYIFYLFCMGMILVYLNLSDVSTTIYYVMITLLGFSVGFWAMFVTVASEQFGTNLRSTTATTVPNFVRGSLVVIAMLFDYLRAPGKLGDLTYAALVVSAILFAISFWAISQLPETFGKDLDYVEE
ncbi:MFS transporter [Cytophaga hutchinsonii]|jgi:putative MFS transporter|uniref:Major facilitator superfamily permease n=1 Tax=Cytophaga hutchinsonii (strain ATCC 33406 / DSM 1761 / CIP 103989 / NBRC 15051 / NCIMB 9469 / D465) TaxID=269798 RepID=A0A6N4SU96_CYTH3|nr:MFS transporter [Cytophaga hutchinsonii]ABG59975.1 major facilitator superfamily permease [Cytophaga hutchinsonii ATCC 33406]SFX26415.1 Major Facilitator Superfamily protein [Cytophaga hutchinsonii ATCC 33406]